MNIVSKLIVFIGIPLLVVISAWAYFIINYQNSKLMEHIVEDTVRLTETIRLGTHYAMTLNSRDDINQIIQNIGRQQGIDKIHLYNKEGRISFSNIPDAVSQKTNIKDEACIICHRSDPPLVKVDVQQRTRIFRSKDGHRLMGILTPIYNEEGCSTAQCHFHPTDKKILGALDVVVSLKGPDKAIFDMKNAIIGLTVLGFIVLSVIIFVFVHRLITSPVQKMIDSTISIASGDFKRKVDTGHQDEMGQLAQAINSMADQINIQQTELNAQRDEYRTLFDDAPCMISVQNRDFKLQRYNRRFFESFNPKPGDYCFQAYKRRNKKCDDCPVEKTFKDGKSHVGQTSGTARDGTRHYWMFIASPIKNARGDVISAIEMSLDITERKRLEKRLAASERKYQSIFNNSPNPVFVLDESTLEIIDCNRSAATVYGFEKQEILKKPFTLFFMDEDKGRMQNRIKTSPILNQVRQVDKAGRTLFVDIWSSPCEYEDQHVLLVATNDITKRLETEQELIQAGKMATLGEMSTGIAHELNQPLSVIKTASDFLLKKINQDSDIDPAINLKLLSKINSNVDRASKIIEHMRHFARKSDLNFEIVNVNSILKRAHDIFSQQLKVRGIEVVWDLLEDIPMIKADPGRIEQVFINLLVNARDAIEEKHAETHAPVEHERITITTSKQANTIEVTVSDTGTGLPDDIKEKIFEPFFTTKEVGKGTGIGLSISYGIIKECKGNIDVFSDPDVGGATFTIRFPAAGDDPAAT